MPSPIQGPQFQAQPWRTLPVTYPASAPTPLSALSGTITDDFNRTDYVLPVTQQSTSNFIDAPAGLVAGDLMLLVICTGAGGVFSAGPTGGWTLVSELTNAAGGGFDCRARLYYRTATSADIATTYTWTTTAGSVHAALTAYRGATGISTTTTGTTGTADSYTAPTTTTASNELMVTVFAAATDSTSANTTRFTTNAPIDEVLATSNFFHCGITDDVDLGRTTAVTATMTAGYHPSWVSWTLAIAGVRRTVPSLGAPWLTVTRSTDPKSLGSVFGIVNGRAQALHDDGVFGATYPSQVYVNASVNGTLEYDFANYFSNDVVSVRYEPSTSAGYRVGGTVVTAPDGSTVTNTLTGGLGYVNGSWSGLSGHARIIASGTDLDVYRDGVHEFHGVMSSNLNKTRFAVEATSGVTFWDNFAWTSTSLSRGWVVGAIGWGGCECHTVYSGCNTVTDAFNRADAGDGTLGTSDSGHRWTNVGGPFDAGFWTTQGTTVNTAQAQVPTIDHYRAMATLLNAHGNNQDISVNGEAADDNSIGILARFSADGMNGYHVLYTAYADNTVTKFVNGVQTVIGGIPRITPNTAFTGRVTIKDNSLKVYLNGTLQLTAAIDADDANCHCETDWTYLGFREDHGGPGGSAPSQITVYANTHWDNLSVVAP